MPLIEIHMLSGRTAEQKRALLEGITKVVQESISAPLDSIKIWIDEFERTDFITSGVMASDKVKQKQ